MVPAPRLTALDSLKLLAEAAGDGLSRAFFPKLMTLAVSMDLGLDVEEELIATLEAANVA